MQYDMQATNLKSTLSCLIQRALLGLCLMFSGSSLAQIPDITLQVYTEVRNSNELQQDTDGNRNVNNRETRLLFAMLNEAGFAFDLKVYPWARISQGLDSEVNMLAYPVTRTASREQRWQWIGPIQPLDYYFYGLRTEQAVLPANFTEAKNFRIGTINGDVIDEYLQSQGFENLVNMVDISRAPLLLMRGRFDLFVLGQHRIEEFIALHEVEPDTLVPMFRLDEISTALYFTMSKQTEPQVLNRLIEAYNRIVADGTFEEIMGYSIAPEP